MECQACEFTMLYGSETTTKTGRHALDEVVVIQQRTTGEKLVVYRGFLAEGGRHIKQNNYQTVSFV